MGKITDQAIRIGHEKNWQEFAKFHPEIEIFFDGETPIDVEFRSSKIDEKHFQIINGVLDCIQYIYEGELIKYPPHTI